MSNLKCDVNENVCYAKTPKHLLYIGSQRHKNHTSLSFEFMLF